MSRKAMQNYCRRTTWQNISTRKSQKQAIFNSNGKQKVRDIIERFGISDQDYAGCNSIESLFYNKIDYEVVRDKVDVFRKESKRFLAKYIGDERICQ